MIKSRLSLIYLFALLIIGTPIISRAMSPEARKSLAAMEQRAAAGDGEAMYRLSALYERGYDSIPADSLKATELLHKSAATGFPPAMNYLGYLLINRDHNYIDGIKWLKEAADVGDPKAASNLGFIIINDTTGRYSGLYANPDSVAAHYIEVGASAGLPHAKSLLGDLYREGRGVECDTLKAATLYEEALQSGLADAETRLINMMGRNWLKLPAEKALQLGKEYFLGYAPYAGVLLLTEAAKDNGEIGAEAKALLSDAYATARGAEYNYNEAMRLLKESADAGYEPAIEKLKDVLEFFPDAFEIEN